MKRKTSRASCPPHGLGFPHLSSFPFFLPTAGFGLWAVGQGVLHMYLSGTVVGVANAALFHPVDSIRIRYFFLPRSKKAVHMEDIRGVSFWKGLGSPSLLSALLSGIKGTPLLLTCQTKQGSTCSRPQSSRWPSILPKRS